MSSFAYKHTTKIAVEKTAAEMLTILFEFGASNVSIMADGGGPCGISFSVNLNGQVLDYALPVRWEAVYKNMKTAPNVKLGKWDEEQARRTSWRIIYEWLKVQLAMVIAGSVEATEVFLPYMTDNKGVTVYQKAIEQGMVKLLEAPHG